jgi:hypothetical protein
VCSTIDGAVNKLCPLIDGTVNMTARYPSIFARLVANSTTVAGQADTGCWKWTGNKHPRGYGRLAVRRPGRPKPIKLLAHRVMEQQLRINAAQFAADDAMPGLLLAPTVPAVELDADDETLDHLCYCTGCINPDHWEPVSRAENTRRRWAA